uniref:Uncharacterized protein n=1 Tax=Brassica oleracea var. oleracea TaxID=109376 RepID=A0A0D3AWJ7_BRAOL
MHKAQHKSNYPIPVQSRSNSSSPSGSTTSTPSGSAGPTGSSLSGSESSATTTVAELEGETSEEVMSFIMNLEKKPPPKEEYKSFEKLRDTMVASATGYSRKEERFLLWS